MNYKVLVAALLIATAASGADDEIRPPPQGWQPMGNGGTLGLTSACILGVDGDMATAETPNMTIKCAADEASFGGLTNSFEAKPYWGKRVRFSAWLRGWGLEDVGDVEGGGALWIAVPSPNGPVINGMRDRRLTGYTSWEYRDFVVDVPEQAGPWLVIGFWAQGRGQLWVKDLKFEEVPTSVPVNLTADEPILGPQLNLE